MLGYINKNLRTFFGLIEGNRDTFMALIKGFYGTDDEIDNVVWKEFSKIAEEISHPVEMAVNLGFIRREVDSVEFSKIILGLMIHIAQVVIRDQKLSFAEAHGIAYRGFVGMFIPYIGKPIIESFTLKEGVQLIEEGLKIEE